MNVVILKDGTYNDARHHAHALKAGDFLETGKDYGEQLVADGFANGFSRGVIDEAQAAEDVAAGLAPDVPAETPADEPALIDLSDGVDDVEASTAGKALSARKRSKAK
jgi:hypothetical protein